MQELTRDLLRLQRLKPRLVEFSVADVFKLFRRRRRSGIQLRPVSLELDSNALNCCVEKGGEVVGGEGGGEGSRRFSGVRRGGKGDSCRRDGTAPSFRCCTARTKPLGSTLNQLVRRAGQTCVTSCAVVVPKCIEGCTSTTFGIEYY